MIKIGRNCSKILAGLLLTMLLAACGSKQTVTTTATSSQIPGGSYAHSVAFSNNITFTWGVNVYGQLGNGNITAKSTPGPVLAGAAATTGDLTGMSGISAGGTHTLAFVVTGPVYAWGNNGYGQLGDNSIIARTKPVQVLDGTTTIPYSPLTGITAVAAGADHSLALIGGTVWAWGSNSLDQLGDVTPAVSQRSFAKQVSSPLPVNIITMIAAGGGHSLALDSSANVWSWGFNRSGQLGQGLDPAKSIKSPTPVLVKKADGTALTGVIHIAAGGSHSLFIVNDGVNPATVWACGLNVAGQLGVGTTVNKNSVVQIVNDSLGNTFTGATAVAAGLDHSLALMSDKTVWAWGDNTFGQLGNPINFHNGVPVTRPVQVMVNATTPFPLSGVTKIVAIGNHNLALKDDGTLWAWGENSFGQLGNGTTANSRYAIEVTGIPNPDLYMP
jgi:alpha-tubulin suppressor-like RCC1 family protein